MENTKVTKTLKVRIRDKHAAQLREWARSVNFVWNYINELSTRSIRERGTFLSGYDFHRYTSGSGKLLGLHSQTIQGIAEEYATRRKQFKKTTLAWRKSGGVRRSLGWVPFKAGAAKWKNGQIFFHGKYFKAWDTYGLGNYEFRSGSFNEDARGRWYFNVVVSVERKLSAGQDKVGIDLGLKTVATCSDGQKLEAGRFYRDLEKSLMAAQRARKKKRVRAIHAKIANRRKDSLHKFSNALVARCGTIIVGDVSSQKLAKTKMAKSVLDSGWFMLKAMLEYKCDHAGIVFKVVDEKYTTQTCSSCGSLPASRPRGIAGLGIREWTCVNCGAVHDRDVNAAKNIVQNYLHFAEGQPKAVVSQSSTLAVGHDRPAVGIPLHS